MLGWKCLAASCLASTCEDPNTGWQIIEVLRLAWATPRGLKKIIRCDGWESNSLTCFFFSATLINPKPQNRFRLVNIAEEQQQQQHWSKMFNQPVSPGLPCPPRKNHRTPQSLKAPLSLWTIPVETGDLFIWAQQNIVCFVLTLIVTSHRRTFPHSEDIVWEFDNCVFFFPFLLFFFFSSNFECFTFYHQSFNKASHFNFYFVTLFTLWLLS